MTPLELQVLLAIHCCGHSPDKFFYNSETWKTPVAEDIKKVFLHQGIITAPLGSEGWWNVTDKGKAWLDYILATPMPVASWTLPERKP